MTHENRRDIDMKINSQFGFGFAAVGLLLTGLVVLPGCSGTSEDVRITFCKNLTNALTDTTEEVAWREPEVQIKRPEFAAVTVEFEAEGENTTGTCYYAYDLVEESAMHLANPILSYATLPYRMTLNGNDLSEPFLTKITSDAQIRQGKIAMDRIKRVTRNAADQLQMTASEAAGFAKRTAAEATAFAKQAADDASAYVKETTQQIKERLDQ